MWLQTGMLLFIYFVMKHKLTYSTCRSFTVHAITMKGKKLFKFINLKKKHKYPLICGLQSKHGIYINQY